MLTGLLAALFHMQSQDQVSQKDKPSVLLISHSFHPASEIGARRPTAFARFLVSRGIKVVVVSAFGEAMIPVGAEILPGVIAIPVHTGKRVLIDRLVALKRWIQAATPAEPREMSRKSVGKSTYRPRWFDKARDTLLRTLYFGDRYKAWGRRAYVAAVKAGRDHRVGVVLSSSPPQTVLVVGALTAAALHKPHIVDFRDPWTDQLMRDDWLARAEFGISRYLEGRVLRSAAAILSTGSKLAELFAARYPSVRERIAVVRNGFDGGFVGRSAQTGGKLTIMFAGELYMSRNPFPFLKALEELLEREDVDAARVSVTFMGEVAEYGGQSLVRWLGERKWGQSVRILPRQPKSVVDAAVEASTTLLNFAQGMPLQIPAKTYEHLASGREILVICESDSETAQVVAGIEGVNCVDPRDTDALREVLVMLYRRHVLEGKLIAPDENAVARFSREASNDTFWQVIRATLQLDVKQ